MVLAEVDIAQGGADLVVAEQALQGGQVATVLEGVGGVAVPERVQAGLLGDAAGAEQAATQAGQVPAV